jgi:hypothetical protein
MEQVGVADGRTTFILKAGLPTDSAEEVGLPPTVTGVFPHSSWHSFPG